MYFQLAGRKHEKPGCPGAKRMNDENSLLIIRRGKAKQVGLLGVNDDSLTVYRHILGLCSIFHHRQSLEVVFVHKCSNATIVSW
jgi:hypothetical protein